MDFKYEPGRILLPVLCRMQHKEMGGIIAGAAVWYQMQSPKEIR